MSNFDFASYLRDRISFSDDHTLEIEILTGGVTNHTARVIFKPALPLTLLPGPHSGNASEKSGGLLHSVILKHAPPYIAGEPTHALPVTRQLVEKKALQILNGEDPEFVELSEKIRLCDSFRRGSVKVPKLIWHDEEKDVLWIEDLGKMKTLSEVLLQEGPSLLQEDEERRMILEKTAVELGQFITAMYLATTNPPQSLVDYLASLKPAKGIEGILTAITRDVLKTSHLGDEDVDFFVELVRSGLNEKDKETVCLGMVDFWSESVLVPVKVPDGKLELGLVDWEYFGVSNAAKELGLFLAHLHVHMLNSTSSSTVKDNIRSFLSTMCHTCRCMAGKNGKFSTAFMRGLLIAHGRELIGGVQFYSARLNSDSKKVILEAGVRSLKAAGNSPDTIDLTVLKFLDAVHDEQEAVRNIWDSFQTLGLE